MMKYCNKLVQLQMRMDSRLRGNDKPKELFAEKLHKAIQIAQLELKEENKNEHGDGSV